MNNFDQTMGDLGLYVDPYYLKDKRHQDFIANQDFKREEVIKYFRVLSTINQVFKKTIKYDLFFSEFYPANDKIQKHEALRHHIHAYLEDIDRLRNKLCAFLGILKNDLRKIAINKKEITKLLDFLIAEVNKVFKNVSEHRHSHHHRGTEFVDNDLLDAEMADMLLTNPLRDSLLKIEAIEEFKKRKIDSFEKAKKKWTAVSITNSEQISGLVNDVLSRTKGFLYQFLNIKPLNLSKN